MEFTKRIVESVNGDGDGDSPRVKTAVYLSCVAGVCALFVVILVSWPSGFRRERRRGCMSGPRPVTRRGRA